MSTHFIVDFLEFCLAISARMVNSLLRYLGPVITYILPQYRNISLLAKQALTVQEISNGRLEFRTGVGAIPQWVSKWWHPYTIDYPNNAGRVSLFKEGIK